ncbi:MAG TPA: FlgD immunoglobulin-like domain containing protein [Ignavibacteriaceae bacterium]|nr:FlgD immunoglobulin-like domain containing protein [Ignavibacteriaceae bacterium]
MKLIFNLLYAFIFLCGLEKTFAVENNQWDNFSDSTTAGWTSGAANPNPPEVGLNGPAGSDDKVLLASSSGVDGPGGKLVVFNSLQWAGNYITAGVAKISMHVNNLGATNLFLRLAFIGSGGNFWTVKADTVPSGSGWISISFSIETSDLAGGTNLNATMSNVTSLRILHSTSGGYNGTPIAALLAIDDITAAAEPLPVEIISFSAALSGSGIYLKWETSSEKNNRGFEVERKITEKNSQGEWHLLGFKEGHGTSNEKHTYSFADNIERISPGNIYYRLKQIDFNGEFTYSNIAAVELSPQKFSLNQNYPNPFNPSTQISFQIETSSNVELKIFDILGNEVKTLLKEVKPGGFYSVSWNGKNNSGEQASSGTYFYRLSADGFTSVRKMILLR